jgi:uncharacterized protein YndB with AHSA1/START domain
MNEKGSRSAKGTSNREFFISRAFNGPRKLVSKAWTEPERLKHRWGPKGFTMLSCNVDLRPDGLFHYGMRSPDGQVLWGKFVYREIAKPKRLVFIVSFSDEKGPHNSARLGTSLASGSCEYTDVAEHRGKTTVTITGASYGATELERKTFESGFESI